MKIEQQISNLYRKLASISFFKEQVIKWLQDNCFCIIEFEVKDILNNKFELQLDISYNGTQDKIKKLEKYFNDSVKSWFFCKDMTELNYDLKVCIETRQNLNLRCFDYTIVIFKD